jgi:hypothetical protein
MSEITGLESYRKRGLKARNIELFVFEDDNHRYTSMGKVSNESGKRIFVVVEIVVEIIEVLCTIALGQRNCGRRLERLSKVRQG